MKRTQIIARFAVAGAIFLLSHYLIQRSHALLIFGAMGLLLLLGIALELQAAKSSRPVRSKNPAAALAAVVSSLAVVVIPVFELTWVWWPIVPTVFMLLSLFLAKESRPVQNQEPPASTLQCTGENEITVSVTLHPHWVACWWHYPCTTPYIKVNDEVHHCHWGKMVELQVPRHAVLSAGFSYRWFLHQRLAETEFGSLDVPNERIKGRLGPMNMSPFYFKVVS